MAHQKTFLSAARKIIIACFIAGTVVSATSYAQNMPSLDVAVATAKKWSVLADARQGDRMYRDSGALIKNSITSDNWNKYLGDVASQFGSVRDRQLLQAVRVTDPESLPKGEYLNVVFFTRYDLAPALETVSLSASGNTWLPVGYVVRKVEPATTQPATPGK